MSRLPQKASSVWMSGFAPPNPPSTAGSMICPSDAGCPYGGRSHDLRRRWRGSRHAQAQTARATKRAGRLMKPPVHQEATGDQVPAGWEPAAPQLCRRAYTHERSGPAAELRQPPGLPGWAALAEPAKRAEVPGLGGGSCLGAPAGEGCFWFGSGGPGVRSSRLTPVRRRVGLTPKSAKTPVRSHRGFAPLPQACRRGSRSAPNHLRRRGRA
jgi:hypothetical protein